MSNTKSFLLEYIQSETRKYLEEDLETVINKGDVGSLSTYQGSRTQQLNTPEMSATMENTDEYLVLKFAQRAFISTAYSKKLSPPFKIVPAGKMKGQLTKKTKKAFVGKNKGERRNNITKAKKLKKDIIKLLRIALNPGYPSVEEGSKRVKKIYANIFDSGKSSLRDEIKELIDSDSTTVFSDIITSERYEDFVDDMPNSSKYLFDITNDGLTQLVAKDALSPKKIKTRAGYIRQSKKDKEKVDKKQTVPGKVEPGYAQATSGAPIVPGAKDDKKKEKAAARKAFIKRVDDLFESNYKNLIKEKAKKKNPNLVKGLSFAMSTISGGMLERLPGSEFESGGSIDNFLEGPFEGMPGVRKAISALVDFEEKLDLELMENYDFAPAIEKYYNQARSGEQKAVAAIKKVIMSLYDNLGLDVTSPNFGANFSSKIKKTKKKSKPGKQATQDKKPKTSQKKMTPWGRAGAITKRIIKKSPWASKIDLAHIQYILREYFLENSNTFQNSLQTNNRPAHVGDGKWGRETYNAILNFQKDVKMLIKQGKLNDSNLELPSGKKLDKFQADGIYGFDTHVAHRVTIFTKLRKSGGRVDLSAEPKPVAPAADTSGKKPTAVVAKTGANAMTIEAAMPGYAELKWLQPMVKAINDEWNENQTRPSPEQAAQMEQLAKFLIIIMRNTKIEIPQGAKPEDIVIKRTKLIFNITIKDPKFKEGLGGPSALDEFLKEIQGLAQERVKESKAYAYLEKLINEELDKLLG